MRACLSSPRRCPADGAWVAFGAVNAVSLYVERGHVTFDAVHVEATARVGRRAHASGVQQLIHVSGIGADPASPAAYIASRGRGEIAVQQSFSRRDRHSPSRHVRAR
jgi:NADH dehydrogenase